MPVWCITGSSTQLCKIMCLQHACILGTSSSGGHLSTAVSTAMSTTITTVSAIQVIVLVMVH
jgi:hypothetical protein